MALTIDVLRANAALAGLTDEQLTAITTLSVNDENSVIAKKTGEIYGGLDADILAASGIAKNGTEKTFDYAKRVLTEFKTKVDGANGLQSQIDSLTKEKARLEKAIADGATDAETAKALKQAKADLKSVTTQYNDLKSKYDEAEKEHTNEVFGIRVETALQTATAGLKFKAGLPESATKVLLDQAIAKIKGMNPEYIDDGKGGKILAFKDESGAIMRNPNNQLNPYTPGDLLAKELETMGILDKGRQAAGGGTVPPAGGSGGGGGTTIDITGAKTRVEAYEAIAANLMAQGLTAGSEKFDAAMKQAWQDNNIAALPEK
ncbi:hypothetical protein [Barnesiella intestinihominis]|uniref:hypothetical protein n=1 Tax=Barnesiella intestinihominis TaxID=487174 RepID=UPI003AB1788A